MANRTDNTMIEWEQKMLKYIAEGKLLADADMPFLVSLENMILDHAKGRSQQAQQAAGMQQSSPMPMSAPTRGGVMGSPAPPTSDEVARMLGPAAGPQ